MTSMVSMRILLRPLLLRLARGRAAATVLTCLLSGLLVACSANPIRQAEEHLSRARQWSKQGKRNEALIEYRKALQKNPNLIEARLELAQAYAHRGELLVAYKEFQAVLKQDPSNSQARIAAAELLLLSQNFVEAQKEAEKVLENTSAQETELGLRALMVLAESARGLRDSRRARAAAERILESTNGRDRESAGSLAAAEGRAWYLLGVLEVERGNVAAGQRHLERAVAAETERKNKTESWSALWRPSWLEAHVALASLLVKRGQTSTAEQLLRAAQTAHAEDLEANYLLASFLWHQRRWKEAQPIFARIASLGADNPVHRGALAFFFAASGQTERAEREFLEIRKKHPEDLLNGRRLATLYLLTGRKAEAQRTMDQLLKQNPNDAATLLLRSQLLMDEGRADEGLEVLRRAKQAEPRSAVVAYFLAAAYLRRGELQLAEAELRNAVQLDPDLPAPRVLLAQFELNRGKADQALTLVEKALAQQPAAVEPYLVRSMALAQQGDLRQAERDLLRLLEEFPGARAQALTYCTAAWLRLHQKRYAEARAAAERSLALQPQSREAFLLWGLAALADKQPNLAPLEAYLQNHANWAAGLEVLGQLLAQQRRYAEAEAYLEKALALDPKLSSAQLLRADLTILQGRQDQARDLLTQLVAQQPRLAAAHVRLGQLYDRAEDWKRAEECYRKALEADPNNAVAKNNLAWLYAEYGGNIDVALRLAQEAREAVPADPMIANTLGWIYVKKRSYASAIQLLRESVEKMPKRALYRYHLGVAYLGAGRTDEAKEALETALRLEPDFPGAEEARKLLARTNN